MFSKALFILLGVFCCSIIQAFTVKSAFPSVRGKTALFGALECTEVGPGDPFALIRSQGLSIGVGVTGIFILLGNRLSVDLDKVTDVQVEPTSLVLLPVLRCY